MLYSYFVLNVQHINDDSSAGKINPNTIHLVQLPESGE